MNIDNNFTDYIKEDMWHASDSLSIDGCTRPDSHFPRPPAFNIDVDILFLLAQDEIHTVEQQIRGEWGRPQWGSNIWEYDPVFGGPENHWEGVETGFHRNSWETSLTTSPDICPMDWSCSSLQHEPSHNIPDYTFPICGSYPPTSYHQTTEPLANGPPPVCTKNYKEGLQWETPIGDIPHDVGGPLQATETSCIDALRARITGDITGDIFGRAVGLPFVQPLPDCQPLVEMHLNRETECQPSPKSGTFPALPSTTKADLFSAELSLHRKGMKSSVSTPLHPPDISQVNLPPATTKPQCKTSGRVLRESTLAKRQSSPSEDVADGKATLGTPRSTFRNLPCISEVTDSRKRSLPPTDECSPSETTDSMQQQKRKRRSPSGSAALASRKLQILLRQWGFVKNKNAFRCTCGKSFKRGWDAGRHWTNVSFHKAQRQNSGDFSDSTRNLCHKCEEVLSRGDSLVRHHRGCGQRRKRRHRNGWNPKALGRQSKREATSKKRRVSQN